MKQREIKFRAWDKEIKAFVYITLLKGGQFIFEIPGVESKEGWNKKTLGEWHQYIGRHDKNGKEIFESDLIKVKDVIRRVVFIDGKFQLTGVDEMHNAFYDLQPSKELEVIGNWWVRLYFEYSALMS